jgi:hypothetical protein
VKTNVTAALNQTGVDGVASAASSLTATSANATCVQQLTLASAARASSVYLKRITGTGIIQVTLDGSTWSTVDLSNGGWNRIVMTGTLTNPAVGVLIATSGDAVAMDFGQIEANNAATPVTSPIYTSSAAATRSVDTATMSGANLLPWFDGYVGTLYAEGLTPLLGSNTSSGPSMAAASNPDSAGNSSYYAIFNSTASGSRSISYGATVIFSGTLVNTLPRFNIKSVVSYSLPLKTASSCITGSSVGVISGMGDFAGQYPLNIFYIGRGANSLWNSCIKRIVFHNKKLSDAAIFDEVNAT